MHVAIAVGGPYTVGALRSQSTRRAPYVQLIDVAATVLDLRGVKPGSEVDGQPWRTSGHHAPSPSSLAELDTAAGAAGDALVWVVAFLVVLVVAGSGLSLLGRRRIAALVLLTALAAPVMTYLVDLFPWYDAPQPTLVTMGASLAGAGVLAVLAFQVGAAAVLDDRRRPCLRLYLRRAGRRSADRRAPPARQPLGYSPLVAGRFAGVGNVGFGVLAGGAVLARPPSR